MVYVASTGDARRIAGFAVPKAVGGAVIRNRVKRRLRAIVADALPTLPAGTGVVVRALPAAAQATYSQLCSDVRSAVLAASERAFA